MTHCHATRPWVCRVILLVVPEQHVLNGTVQLSRRFYCCILPSCAYFVRERGEEMRFVDLL